MVIKYGQQIQLQLRMQQESLMHNNVNITKSFLVKSQDAVAKDT